LPDQLRLLLGEDVIAQRVAELGQKIASDYRSSSQVLFVGVLNGAFIFLADIVRQLDFPHAIDFLRVASYGASTETTGAVQIRKDLEISASDRHLVIIEDIVDTGLTLSFLLGHLAGSRPRSIEVCTLLDKPSRRQVDLVPKYVGFTIANEFVVGYGMDYNEKYRHLAGIHVCVPDPTEGNRVP
jgi:hypoxanthine phosphoribosyltransferase